MSTARPGSVAALVRLRLAGVAFLVVIGLLVALTIALYNKTFTTVAFVTLRADRIGNQLSPTADVKLRGLVVGEVRSVAVKPDGASIRLAIAPDKLRLIPANVAARLLPKTLFGEKFVDLIIPADPSTGHLRAGDTIPQDRSSTGLETERVLNDLLPLLQQLKPAQVSLTLNALSSALRDRGDRIGSSLARTGAYLQQLNPQLPGIQRDMEALADVSNSVNTAAPSLLRTLDNLSFSSRSLVDQQHQLDAFLHSTTGFANSAEAVVSDNAGRLVSLAATSLPSLQTYARYAPEFPCLAAGLVAFEPTVERAFGGGQPGLHITLSVTRDNGQYVDGQQPQNLDNRGPVCYGLPHPVVPAPDINFADGYKDGQPTTTALALQVAGDPASYLAGSQGQRRLLDSVAAPLLGVGAAQVPDVVTLLFGPMARGTEVDLS